jgi:hypothetical protein
MFCFCDVGSGHGTVSISCYRLRKAASFYNSICCGPFKEREIDVSVCLRAARLESQPGTLGHSFLRDSMEDEQRGPFFSALQRTIHKIM